MTAPFIIRDQRQRAPTSPWLVLVLSLAILLVTIYVTVLDVASRTVLIQTWGMQPVEVFQLFQQDWQLWFRSGLLTPFTALLIHASWLHLLGNLAYLWAFGLSVERYAGHINLAIIFFIAGGMSNILLAWQLPEFSTPVIGASGGVSAIIGAYLCLFPRRRMGLYLPLGLYLKFARLPSLLVITSWFLLQLIYTVQGPLEGNVVWRVHLVGFVAGILAGILLRLFAPQIARMSVYNQ